MSASHPSKEGSFVEPAPPRGLVAVQSFLTGVFQRENPVADDLALSNACADHVTGSARMTAAEQVDVYRHQFWLRHRASLEEDYPGLQHIVGDEEFDSFVRAYLTAHVPRTPSLRDLGADILGFAATYPWPAERRDLALEMIRYEHAWVDVFDGPDPPPLDAEVLKQVPPDAWATARVRLNPCVVRLPFRYPVHRLRYAVIAKESPALPEPSPDGFRLALFRTQNVLHFEELSLDALTLLDALDRGVPLVPACELITKDKSDAEIEKLNPLVGQWFAAWARWGFISAIELAEPSHIDPENEA